MVNSSILKLLLSITSLIAFKLSRSVRSANEPRAVAHNYTILFSSKYTGSLLTSLLLINILPFSGCNKPVIK